MAAKTKKKSVNKTEPEMITVKVDGKPVSVPKTTPDPITGKPVPTTMIQACEAAGIDVPHYCYHPKLPVAGNCRMCLVEYGMPALGPDRKPILDDDGNPKIARQVLPYERGTPRGAIACATPIAPNMEIYPSSNATKEMREAVLESLLINHPLDCPICDQAGECKLQEYSIEHGQAGSQFAETKVHKPKQVDLGPRIMLDDERCVLCSRCIRFTRDIAGDDALGFVNRGSYNTLAAFPGKKFDNNYTLNTVDICPVGALTSKDFRFQMRVWFLKETKTLCDSCGTGCNVVAGSREGKMYRYEPRDNDAVNSSWMCDYGRLNYKWIQDANRLSTVLHRPRQSAMETSDWATAIKGLATHLNEVTPKSVAIIGSGRLTTEELYLISILAKRVGGVTDVPARKGEGDHLLLNEDRNPNSNGARVTKVTGKRLGAKLRRIAEGIESGEITTLLVFREDLANHGFDRSLLKKLKLLVYCGLFENETSKVAHYSLPGCAHLEKRGTFINIKGRLQKFMQGIDGPGVSKPEWEFLRDLLQAMGMDLGFSSIEGLFNQMASSIKAMDGVKWSSIGPTGVDIEI